MVDGGNEEDMYFAVRRRGRTKDWVGTKAIVCPTTFCTKGLGHWAESLMLEFKGGFLSVRGWMVGRSGSSWRSCGGITILWRETLRVRTKPVIDGTYAMYSVARRYDYVLFCH